MGEYRIKATANGDGETVKGTDSRSLRPWRRVAAAALALGVVVAVSSCGDRASGNGSGGRGDVPMFQDAMADIEVANAKRLSRHVQEPRFGNGLEKAQFAEVMQTFQAPGEGAAALAVRDSIVHLAKNAGWTITETEPGQHGVVVGEKTIDNSKTTLTVNVSSYQRSEVVLILS